MPCIDSRPPLFLNHLQFHGVDSGDASSPVICTLYKDIIPLQFSSIALCKDKSQCMTVVVMPLIHHCTRAAGGAARPRNVARPTAASSHTRQLPGSWTRSTHNTSFCVPAAAAIDSERIQAHLRQPAFLPCINPKGMGYHRPCMLLTRKVQDNLRLQAQPAVSDASGKNSSRLDPQQPPGRTSV